MSFIGNTKVIELVIVAGANVDALTEGITPLHYVSLIGNAKIVELLVTNGANFDIVNNDGITPYMYAESNECNKKLKPITALFDRVISGRVKVKSKQSEGNSPPSYASTVTVTQ